MPPSDNVGRRSFLKASLLTGGLAAAGGLISVQSRASGKTQINMQLGWLASVNNIGEVVAKRLGYFEQEGIDFTIQPGGPNIDGVAVVASGHAALGEVSSSPSIMMAVSQGLPIKCFAVGAQRHPYAFFSLQKKPVRKPADLVGKKIGMQTTGMVLLRALLAQNKISEKDVDVVPIGSDLSPLLTGQVDTLTGWLTSTSALKVLGPERVDMPLWDAGVRLYALPYYANTQTLEAQPRILEGFLRAAARGWRYAASHRDEAVDLLVSEYPNLKREDERLGLDVMIGYSFGGQAQTEGWGAMDPAIWQNQIALYSQLGQFTARTPNVEDVMTLDLLKATLADRIKA
jgi:NitT/TauT family transport system substrate-binding protein